MDEILFSRFLYRILPTVYRTRDNGGKEKLSEATLSALQAAALPASILDRLSAGEPLGAETLAGLPAGQRELAAVAEAESFANTGDLEKYLGASGSLLDGLQNTLRQRMADQFPDDPEETLPPELHDGLKAQAWILPYFARLLDVRLLSPLAAGQRSEISNAISWRQKKGTLAVVDQVSEALCGLEAVVSEGWMRMAVTARIGVPLVPATSLGHGHEPYAAFPGLAARHPGIPAVTPDFRCPARAVACPDSNPAAQRAALDGLQRTWRQSNAHGAPCFPGSFEDPSRRTPDLRASDWRVGHFHPKKALIHYAPPPGFFPPGATTLAWDPDAPDFRAKIDVIEEEGRTEFRNRTWGTDAFVPVRVSGPVEIGLAPMPHGRADAHAFAVRGLVFTIKLEVDAGRVELEDCAVKHLETHGIDTVTPVIQARNCVFGDIQNARGLSRLEYVTVLGATLSETLEASDCIFLGRIRRHHVPLDPPPAGCLRYSRIIPGQAAGGMSLFRTHSERVWFFSDTFGARSCGVLHPASPASIRFGAEDGGEVGGCHGFAYSLCLNAMEEKLKDFVPVGMQAIAIPDARLLKAPLSLPT